MKLFVGLGNVGSKYAGHRHNVGFMAVERIAARYRFPAWRKRFQGQATDGEVGGERVLLLKPETYMNESGRAVGEAVRFLKIAEADVVAFHDELDLAPGKLRIKSGGGNAGHNGLRSLSAHIGNEYQRVRIGIGHPGVKELVHHWVLSDFAKADAQWLDPLLDAIAESAVRLATGDVERFAADVQRIIDPPPAKKSPPPASDRSADRPDSGSRPDASSRPESAPRPPSPGRHPAGERMAKRQSALGENLKKWMAKTPKPDGET